jgi:DNA-binding SARP family transcriptional activator
VALLRIQILGPVRAWRGDNELDLGPNRQRAIFALLALAGGQPLPRAEMIDVLWHDRPPPAAINVIQTHVKRLRRVLEPERAARAPSHVLVSSGNGYALNVAPDRVDLMRFRGLVADARRVQEAEEFGPAVTLYLEALRLWQREALAGISILANHPDVVALRGERQAVLAHLTDVAIATGAAVDAVPILEQDAAAQPLDEAAQARLIRVYHAAGQRARAIAKYEAVRDRLAAELGVDPGRHLASARAAVLAGPQHDHNRTTNGTVYGSHHLGRLADFRRTLRDQ